MSRIKKEAGVMSILPLPRPLLMSEAAIIQIGKPRAIYKNGIFKEKYAIIFILKSERTIMKG